MDEVPHLLLQSALTAGGVLITLSAIAWRWSERLRGLADMAKNWPEVEYELRINGMRRERANEPTPYRDRSLRDLVVELHERGPLQCLVHDHFAEETTRRMDMLEDRLAEGPAD